MKKVIVGLMVIAIASSAASAAFTPALTDLQGFTLQVNGGATTISGPLTGSYPLVTDPTMVGQVGWKVYLPAPNNYYTVGKSGFSLTSGDTYLLTLSNDDDDLTKAWLFIGGSTSGEYSIPADSTITLSMTIPGSVDSLTILGYGVKNNKPTGGDEFYISASPIPAPGALLLAGIGTAVVGWLRRRSA